jgi:hypothetical protein
MQRLSESSQMIVGLPPQALNNTNVTGRYINVEAGRSLRAVLIGGAMATTKTSKIELFQAINSAGGSAKAITSASATITADTLVTEATVALAAVANTDYITINGLAFTKAAGTDAALRTFANAAGLVTCVNHATYGVPGVSASDAGTDVTLYADQAADAPKAITAVATNVAGTITVATTAAQAYVDLVLGLLDHANGFDHVAAKVTTTANTVVGVVFDFYDRRYLVDQEVGAAAVV